MMPPIRLMFILLIVQAIAYVVLSLYSRSVRKGKLEAAWEEEQLTGDRDAFIQKGLKDYDGSIRRKLILAVFIVPQLAIGVLIYVTNFM